MELTVSSPCPTAKSALFIRSLNYVTAGKTPELVLAQWFSPMRQFGGHKVGDLAVNGPQILETIGVLCDNFSGCPCVAAVKVIPVDNDFVNHVPHQLPVIVH